MSEAAVAPQAHPIGLIDSDDLKRSRLTVFFRYLLTIPHFLWLVIWGIAAELAARSPGWSRSSPAGYPMGSTASSPATCATRPASTPTCC